MATCLRLYCNSGLKWTLTYASQIASIGGGYSASYGRQLRRFIRTFVNTDDLPENQYGTWNASVLEDEDLSAEIKLHLQEKGKYMKAQDIVAYLEVPEVQQRFKLDEPPSLSTAQRWMKELGFRWKEELKGQYASAKSP